MPDLIFLIHTIVQYQEGRLVATRRMGMVTSWLQWPFKVQPSGMEITTYRLGWCLSGAEPSALAELALKLRVVLPDGNS
jgi:hypothetical protein